MAHCWTDRLRWFVVKGELVSRTPLDEVYAEMTSVCAAVLAAQRAGLDVAGWPKADVWVPQLLELVKPSSAEPTADRGPMRHSN